ncbi:2-oxo acid dehydrogenase subunit E2 [Defluviimonas sp. WL0002]|uniref:Dihydrolipoamide acetyltransferase component of pyruvate dehydrogenase complex n=1 Tax=Albidovulum marisflavi TaxID=2984159 RepID=A0ABT2ZDC6_9RHOB|nr:dihydrolipoamide acetyltransferase family protein [Defluviimonas sp. WL0002]MCV2869117.1 2-oxo acid dehydrogenase subunit E2 [Defluviimonas sp. WL0002]
MPHEFRLQDPGEGIHEAEIVEINVAKGDKVAEGDDVIVAETDKAAVDIPAPVSGTVQEIRVAVGDIVNVGDVLLVFSEDGDGDADKAQSQNGDREPAPTETAPTETAPAKARSDDEPEDRAPEDGEGEWDRDEGDTDEGDTDEGGGGEASDEPERSRDRDEKLKPDEVLATPAVRGLARELGVDLTKLEATGKDGRVTEKAVREAAQTTHGEADDDADAADGEEDVYELRSLRRTTARRMEQAWRDIPHVTHHDVIDITALERLRRKHAPEIEKKGGALTLTPFLVKALAVALADFPDFNATFDAEAREVHRKNRFDVGVALDTERGLLVPVLRNAGQASIIDMAHNLGELAERLREGKARAEDLRGATFTLTNIGPIGGTGLSPIINPPQTAIFGAARAELRQLVKGDLDDYRFELALCLPVCLTFDHRVADGAQAARFVNAVRALLGDPEKLMLHG